MVSKRSQTKIIVTILVMLIFITNAIAVCAVTNKDDRTIKVGFFPMNGFSFYGESGVEKGYNVDYLNKISQYTGWKYEYVRANSWENALQMLEQGQIDILGPAIKTKNRSERFEYSAYQIGIEYIALLTRADNYNIGYEDFNSLNGKKIGCVKNNIFVKAYEKYKNQKGFYAELVYYSTEQELLKALKDKDIDAMVESLMIMDEDLKLISKFSPQSVFYIISKGNNELLNELDRAMEAIKASDMDYENDLTKKYFPQYRQIPFTREELDYINSAPAFRVGCITNLDPISYFDKETGKIAGISKQIIDQISKISGLKFEYAVLPEKQITYQILVDNKIDIISCVENNTKNNTIKNIELSEPYFSSKKVLVGKKGEGVYEKENLRVAITAGYKSSEDSIQQPYQNTEFLVLGNTEECMQAVTSGKADVMLQNQYAVNQYMAKPQYENLSIIFDKDLPDQICLAPITFDNNNKINKFLEDDRLLAIINKSIARLDKDEVDSILISETTARPYNYTMDDFIFKYKNLLCAFFLIALTLLSTFSCIVWYDKKNKEIIESGQRKLRNVTNNIDGGVLVLLPDKDFKILYFNEGFLDLIGMDQEEYDKTKKHYSQFIHEDDFLKLYKTYSGISGLDEKISLELRLFRKTGKSGKYIHTLFNGTLMENIQGEKELCCVVMDITEQNKMREKLEMEQERYQTFMERSESLIFDYDTVKGTIIVSKEFKEKFGWSLPKLFWGSDLTQVWPVHIKDKNSFCKMVDEVFKGSGDGNCRARIMTLNNQYIWCDINFHMIRKNGRNARIVGTVLDVTKQMQEKEALLQKSKTDGLTGLLNKESFKHESIKHLKETKDKTSALIFIDLDNFKLVNDVLGHIVGDRAIKEAAEKIKNIFSSDSIISRFGGDEFCILVKNIKGQYKLDKIEVLRNIMNQRYSFMDKEVTITASIGVATTDVCGDEFDTLLDCADKALYEAKEMGKDNFVLYT